MNYYQPPTDHPNALEMERLQEQMDALIKQRQHLETLDFTEAVEIQHAAIEEQISFLRWPRQGDAAWMTLKTFTTSSSSMSKSRL
jgi:hypothetical protein